MESVKVKVFMGYLTLVVLASLIVWVAYSKVLKNSVNEADMSPVNNKFLYINNILTNLYQAEGLERSYAHTGQQIHYRDYLKLMDKIGLQIDTLAIMLNNPNQQMHTDSIKELLKIKLENAGELASIKKKNTPTVRYQQAIKKLELVNDTVSDPIKVYKNIVTNTDTIYTKQKKKKFFQRLINVFAAQEKVDSNLHIKTTESVQIDSLVGTSSTIDTITSYVTAIVTEMRDESMAAESRLNQKEQEILANDLILTVQLRQVLADIENEELINSYQRVRLQQSNLEKTTGQIILVGAFALVTIIFFLVNILRDITKSQHYRQSLEKAKAYSESLLKSKEQFMLSLTHDLKSPLSSIIGFTELMEHEEKVSPRQKKYLDNISKASEHIRKLVIDLLDLARLETGKLTIESLPCNLGTLIGDIIEGFRPQAQAKKIDLLLEYSIKGSALYLSDPVRITQILGNLISNAIKFTEKGKVIIKVSAQPFSKKIDRIRIDVIDTGIGISEENKQLIFEQFARVSSNKKQYEGTGVGLTITQKIIHLMHGSIQLESKPREGTHFIIHLPLQKSDQVAEIPVEIVKGKLEPVAGKAARGVVWIIDDDQTLLEMIASVLRSIGMQVHTFDDPQKALQSFRKGCADLLIMDIQMPVMNGMELLRKIKEKNGGPIPAIAVSGMNAGQNASPGFSAFIQKPFHPQTLIDVVSGQQIGLREVNNRESYTSTSPNGYNLDQLAAFAAGDPESFREILTSLISTGKDNITLFRQYIEHENKDGISALSHKMLTLFRQMEATDIVELLTRLEQEPKGHENPQYYLWGKLALEKIEALMTTIEKEEHLAAN
ncbi:MAG TPA: hybrid sensor histidine kinase/response regulator [Prolixibacteraceae bacterium]|nr:hybrid sensor histidine kinase/response regulator [Prolixibacteraceae bacterium]